MPSGIAGKAGILAPVGPETSYRVRLRSFIIRLQKIARKAIGVELNDLTASIILRDLELEQVDIVTTDAARAAQIMAEAVDRINDARFGTSMRRLFADEEALERIARGGRAGVADIVDLAVSRNVNLITELTEDHRAELAKEIRREVGETVDEPLETRLAAALGKARNRAALIARDQVGKLNSELAMAKAQAAGAERYEWVTVGDSRVRALHRSLNGNEYLYGEPTDAEGGEPPGIPISCRCASSPRFN